ncbi:MAG: endonuclease [Pseudomonadota bacterium]
MKHLKIRESWVFYGIAKLSLGVLFPATLAMAGLSVRGPANFEQAKTYLNKALAKAPDPPKTWYCGCSLQGHKVPHCDTGITSRKPMTLEWDHVVPAALFPKPISCRSIDGSSRVCARKRSQVFRYAEADLVNLVPAESQVNQLKSSKLPGVDETTFKARCGFEVGVTRFNPPPQKRGDVARIWFHMNKKHFEGKLINLSLSPLLFKWNLEDPISEEEVKRAQKLEKLGSPHYFVPLRDSK